MISRISIDEGFNPAQIIVTSQFSDFDEFLTSYISDLPGGGVHLETDKLLPLGTDVLLSLSLSSNGLPIVEGEGKVFKHIEADEDSFGGMEIQFKNLKEKSKTLLESLVKNYL